MPQTGVWRGWWEQEVFGKQEMHDLTLNFDGCTITGTGRDIVGAFTFRGQHDDQGSVTLIKQYHGRHCVHYQGTYDGEGTIYGKWFIPDRWTGPFVLRLTRNREGVMTRDREKAVGNALTVAL